jgi:two-component system chemotaxis sensor kinase CheA
MTDKPNTQKTILVAEDEKPLLEAIRVKLVKSGFTVMTAREVEEAMSIIDNSPICAIWLDHYLLGKENGLDLVAKIKNHEEYKKIPIFVVSNTASQEKVKTYISLGINKYYIKSNCRLENIISDIENSIS